MTFHKICLFCSKQFESEQPRAAYCSDDCRRFSNEIVCKESKEKRKINKELERHKKNVAAISKINAEAKQAGMSYGKYVAKMGL